jgi:hypothetical protein
MRATPSAEKGDRAHILHSRHLVPTSPSSCHSQRRPVPNALACSVSLPSQRWGRHVVRPDPLTLGREDDPCAGDGARLHDALDRPLVGLLLFGHVARHQVSIRRNMGGQEMA